MGQPPPVAERRFRPEEGSLDLFRVRRRGLPREGIERLLRGKVAEGTVREEPKLPTELGLRVAAGRRRRRDVEPLATRGGDLVGK